MFLRLDIVDNYFPCTMKQFLRVSIKYRQSYCIFGEIFRKKCKICVLVSAYIDAHPAEETNIIYVFKVGYCR